MWKLSSSAFDTNHIDLKKWNGLITFPFLTAIVSKAKGICLNIALVQKGQDKWEPLCYDSLPNVTLQGEPGQPPQIVLFSTGNKSKAKRNVNGLLKGLCKHSDFNLADCAKNVRDCFAIFTRDVDLIRNAHDYYRAFYENVKDVNDYFVKFDSMPMYSVCKDKEKAYHAHWGLAEDACWYQTFKHRPQAAKEQAEAGKDCRNLDGLFDADILLLCVVCAMGAKQLVYLDTLPPCDTCCISLAAVLGGNVTIGFFNPSASVKVLPSHTHCRMNECKRRFPPGGAVFPDGQEESEPFWTKIEQVVPPG